MRAFILAALTLSLSAQQVRVGPETPVAPPQIGRASGFKLFGGAATDGEHVLVVWARADGTTYAVLDGVRNELPIRTTDLHGLIWSGSSYFLLFQPDRTTYALQQIDRNGNAGYLVSVRPFETLPRFVTLASNGDGFIIAAQVDPEQLVVRQFYSNGQEFAQRTFSDAHLFAATNVGRNYAVIALRSGRDLESIDTDGNRTKLATLNEQPTNLTAASDGTTLFVAWHTPSTRNVLIAGGSVQSEPLGNDDRFVSYCAMWDGETYSLFFSVRDAFTERLAVMRYSSNGTKIATIDSVTSEPSEFQSTIAVMRINSGVAMVYSTSGSNFHMRAAISTGALVLPDDGTLLTGDPADQTHPAISSDGFSAVVAWLEQAGSHDVVAAVLPDRKPIVLHRGVSPSTTSNPATTSAQGIHYVFWREAWPDRTLTKMSRINWRGELLDPDPIEIDSDSTTDAGAVSAASNGRDVFVMWAEPGGVAGVIGGRRIQIAADPNDTFFAPRAMWNGRNFVAYWAHRPRSSSPISPALLGSAVMNRTVAVPSGILGTMPGIFMSFAPPLGALSSDIDPTTLTQTIRAIPPDANSRMTTIVVRSRLELDISDIDAMPTRDGALAVFTEIGQRITTNFFDRDLRLRTTTIVTEDATPVSNANLMPRLENARVAAANGHAYIVYTHNLRVVMRQLDATRE